MLLGSLCTSTLKAGFQQTVDCLLGLYDLYHMDNQLDCQNSMFGSSDWAPWCGGSEALKWGEWKDLPHWGSTSIGFLYITAHEDSRIWEPLLNPRVPMHCNE